jgi:hypothetical protein
MFRSPFETISTAPILLGWALLCAILAATAFAASSPIEVLYVTERKSGTISLFTYNVNPQTAVATDVSNPIFVGASNIDPLSIGTKTFVYVWNSTDVWVYPTDEHGAASGDPTQHLAFNFPEPVTTFLVDPDGKFAYAGMAWWDSQNQTNNAAVYLYTIDAATGQLTDTRKAVASYSDAYTFFRSFSFGLSGKKLFVSAVDDGPFTCEPEYDSYRVNQTTGNLGRLTNLVTVTADCGGTAAVTINDQLTGWESTCCGPGSGYLQITRMSTGKQIDCQFANNTFCGDDAGDLTFDPESQNLVFPDIDAKKTFVGHLDFLDSQLIQSPSILHGTPIIYFSPDSLVLYAQYAQKIEINAFQASTGEILASTSLPVKGKVAIATATLNK